MTWTRKEADARRAEILKALQAADGNVTRTAAALGCTRQTVYSHAVKLGLQREFGLLDPAAEPERRLVPSPSERESDVPTLRAVEASETRAFQVQATIRVPDSFWKRVRKAAIDEGCTVSEFVRRRLERSFEDEQEQPKSKGGNR